MNEPTALTSATLRAENAEAINTQLRTRNEELAIEVNLLRQQLRDLKQHIAKEPFYWTRPEGYLAEQCAEEGWYQWTTRGLVYLGTTANLSLDDIDIAASAMLDRVEAENARLQSAIVTAIHTLQSYAFGNQSPELAEEVVQHLKELLSDV